MLEKNDEYYDFVVNRRETNFTKLEDIYDGVLYKNFVESLPLIERNSYATCNFNSDGSPVFKSSNCSIWPVQIMINELPINVRQNKTITWALWFGKNKPNMDIFLSAFAESMNEFSSDGIPCAILNEVKKIKLYPICCCVDSVARAPMQGLIQFNGRFGCNWCLHPGELVKKKKKRVIKYPLMEDIPETRTELETVKHMDGACDSKKPVYGVKKASALLKLKEFNIVRGFVPDAMHCVSLGICRQFSNYWFSTLNGPFSLANKIKYIDKILTSSKVPTQLARSPRSIKERKYWKAREWDNFLLHFSIPILIEMSTEILNEVANSYCAHWALLVDAIHILMRPSITMAELLRAEDNLKQFVGETELLYSKSAMTFNVHQMIHLCQSVVDWGPLWGHIGYGFEDGNGKIVRCVKAANGVINQICRTIDFKQSEEILAKHVSEKEDSPMIEFCSHLESRETKKTAKLFDCRYFGKPTFTSQKWIEELNLSNDFTVSYFRMVKENCIFSSKKKSALRTGNCFAQISDDTLIKIVEFIVDSEKFKEFTICFKVITENLNFCGSVKKVVGINKELMAVETDDIKNIAVYVKIKKNAYISCVPNMFHF